ncbi:MFS transporter [Kribbella hippodromi]|uniref:MFS transporter n=1 Tax=Kribbella hippodromi TaxID=434347 RepID=A0ABN2D7C8_9ACTN
MTNSAAVPVRTSLWRLPAVRQLAVLTTLGFSSFFLTLASLPSYAVRGGTGAGSAGAVTAVMLGCTVAVQAVVPWLERRLGTPVLLVIGLIALGSPAPLYLLSDSLGWLAAISAVRGIGFAILTVIGALLSTSVAPADRRGEAIGVYGLCIAVPNLIAIPAGAALTSSGRFGWVAVLAAAPLLAIPFVLRLRRRQDDSPHTKTAAGPAVRSASGPAIVLLVVMLSGGGLLTFLPIARPDGSLATIALLVLGVCSTVSRWRIGHIHDRFGGRGLQPTMIAAGIVGLALVAIALQGHGRTAALLAGVALFGIGYGATQSLTQIAVFERTPPEQAVTASAVWNTAFDAGTGIGAYGIGLLAATSLELPGTYLLCAALLVLTIPLTRRH